MQNELISIKEYFTLDPLMVPVVVYLCPKDDLPLLCDHVPAYMVIAAICLALNYTKVLLKKPEVCTMFL